MNRFPSKAIVERLRQQYPAGTRVRLIRMIDKFTKLQPGDEGEVSIIDDCGTIFVNWHSCSSLGVIFGEDQIIKVEADDD